MSSPVRLNHMSHTNQNEMGIGTQPPNIKHPKPNDWSKQPHTVAIPLTLNNTFKCISNFDCESQFATNFVFLRKKCGMRRTPDRIKTRFLHSPKNKIRYFPLEPWPGPIPLILGIFMGFILFIKILKLKIFEGLLTKISPLFDARVAIESSQFGEMTSYDAFSDSF